MKLENQDEYKAAFAWLEWRMSQAGAEMAGPEAQLFNLVAKTVDHFERLHYPIPAPEAADPCFDCAHAHEGPVIASPYEETPPGRACLKCACKVRM